jgi:Uma2 family endonuclease
MPVVPEARRYTVEEVLAFPADGNRYEVVQGELLVTPAPRGKHQLISARLHAAFHNYLEPLGVADTVLYPPADITWGIPPREADDLVQPDIFVVHPDDMGVDWLDMKRLLLVAEVVSPSSSRADRVVKRKTYQRHRVETYWVVDADAALAEVWRPEDERPAIVTDILVWRWGQDTPELTISLAELFAPPQVRRDRR